MTIHSLTCSRKQTSLQNVAVLVLLAFFAVKKTITLHVLL